MKTSVILSQLLLLVLTWFLVVFERDVLASFLDDAVLFPLVDFWHGTASDGFASYRGRK